MAYLVKAEEWTVDIYGDDETGGCVNFIHTCGWRTHADDREFHMPTTLDKILFALEHECLTGQGDPT